MKDQKVVMEVDNKVEVVVEDKTNLNAIYCGKFKHLKNICYSLYKFPQIIYLQLLMSLNLIEVLLL